MPAAFPSRRAADSQAAVASWEVRRVRCSVVGMAAYASVQAVAPGPVKTVVVSAAGGGVGSIAVQLARRTGGERDRAGR